MKTVAIIQARMTSTRLPGKVLLPIGGRPMLSYQLERLRRIRGVDQLVIATTTNATDDPIVSMCRSEGVPASRGAELDVLSRYQAAALQFDASTVIRLTSDCPLLEARTVESALSMFEEEPRAFDYVSNMIEPTYPLGMAVEVMTAEALRIASLEATDEGEREHVTPFIYRRPGRFRLGSMTMTPNLSRHRWTVDTSEDFELISRILGSLAESRPDFTLEEVLELLAEHPDWEEINRHVEQRSAGQDSVGRVNAIQN